MQIIVDKEPVIFNGPPPQTIAELYQLLNNAIEQQGCFLVSFLVDDAPLHSSHLAQSLNAFQCICAQSETQANFINKLSEQQISLGKHLAQELEIYSNQLLTHPFSELVPRVESLMKEITPFLETLENTRQYGEQQGHPWAGAVQELLEKMVSSLDAMVRMAAQRDIAPMSEIIQDTLLLTHNAILNFYQNTLPASL